MKTKFLLAALVVSLLLNVAGLVFFICFLRLEGHYRTVKRERNFMVQNLTAARATAITSESSYPTQIIRRVFVSLADGQQDYYAMLPPATPGRDNTLVVYLHGMGSNYLEPFTCPAGQTIAQGIMSKYPDACLLSLSYRKEASWGSDLAMSDINQNIRELLQVYPIKQIVLIGTSMGGCTVLTYATQAPPDIKEKITGIVSVESAGSLKDLYEISQNHSVRRAITQAMGGDYQQAAANYLRKSFLPNIEKLPISIKVAVISASQDRIVPPVLQQKIVEALKQHANPVKLLTLEAEHGAPPASMYVEALDFVMARS